MAHHEKPAIRVKNLHKTFRLPHERYSGLKQKILSAGKGSKGYEVQKVLDDVSFEIQKGEFFGIVGKNGSGKSTLLKSIAGIYAPDHGKVTIDGKLVPFIELGVGFNPELTGRENVFLNGALLGFSRKEMEAMYDEIVEFAELERFMDQKLKNYSSGMQVRLAFSIAIRAQGDILLLDEVLAVGDSAFQQKCFEYFAQLRRDNKTVILVTHNMDSVQRFCTKALMLDEGKIQVIGGTDEVTAAYEEANRESMKRMSSEGEEIYDSHAMSARVKTLSQKGEEVTTYSGDDKIVLDITLTTREVVKDAVLGVRLKKSNGEPVYRMVTEDPNPVIEKFSPDRPTRTRLELQNVFAEDAYTVDVTVKSVDRTKEYFDGRGITRFRVVADTKAGWALRPDYSIEISTSSDLQGHSS
jgi:ABC-2 type transport system ATP-binding protein